MEIILSGYIAEKTGSSKLEKSGLKSVFELIEHLKTSHKELQDYSIKVSVNQKLADESLKIKNGDKIFVFGPYSGG